MSLPRNSALASLDTMGAERTNDLTSPQLNRVWQSCGLDNFPLHI